MAGSLQIRTFQLGHWMTNAYVAWVDGGRACWIIDPGFDPDPLIEAVRDEQLEPELLVLTHAHVDHIAGVNQVRDQWPDLPIVIHEDEARFLLDPALNLSTLASLAITVPPADRTVRHGHALQLGGLRFDIRHTPGHSPGGICMHQPENQVAFVGDTLFREGIGRYDFPTSDGAALLRAIRRQLFTLPDPTRILPGHGPPTTIAHEKQYNPFLM